MAANTAPRGTLSARRATQAVASYAKPRYGFTIDLLSLVALQAVMPKEAYSTLQATAAFARPAIRLAQSGGSSGHCRFSSTRESSV